MSDYILYAPATSGAPRFQWPEIGRYASQSDVRAEIERIAGGRPWGFRPTAEGVEAVCDYAVIAEVVCF